MGTLQTHDDALVVTLRIGGYDVKSPCGLGKWSLNLWPKDLERYESPLVGFDGRTVVPLGMVKLPV